MKCIFKLLGAISCVAMMSLATVACQPTPEDLVVQNKADDDLREAIAQTADPIVNTPEVSQAPPQKVHIVDSAEHSSGVVSINIDADVMMPDMDKIPVAQLDIATTTVEQVGQIIEAIYGNMTFYGCEASKADIEASILRMKKKLNDDEELLNSDMADASGITDLAKLREMMRESIAEAEKRWKRAPSEREIIESIDGALTHRGFHAAVDIGREEMAYVETSSWDDWTRIQLYAFGGQWPRCRRQLEAGQAREVDIQSTDAAFVSAKTEAQRMMDATGIEGVRLGKAYITKDYPGLVNPEKGTLSSNREFYVFCYERMVGEGSIDFTYHRGAYCDDNEVQRSIAYEKLQIWMEGDEVMQFYWENPMRVTRIINENVALAIDAHQATELMKKQAMVQFCDKTGYYDHHRLEVDDIRLELVRIKERSSDHYMVVPAWSFYGDHQQRLTEEGAKIWSCADMKYQAGDYLPGDGTTIWGDHLITINALDGTVIDREKGY